MASVDDIDELIATRKLNGVNDNLYRHGSDTNVGSIEKRNISDKEIEDLNDFADLLRPEKRYYTNIIKKVIEDKMKDREKIKELEEENIQKDLEIIGTKEYTETSIKEIIKQYYTANEDCVSKQKIKDLKESIKIEPVIVGGRRNRKTLEYGIKLGKIKACEELLEENK